jgi:hypothetical protein
MTDTAPRRNALEFFGRTHPVTGDWEMQRPPTLDDAALAALPEFGTNNGLARSTIFCDPNGADGNGLSLIWLRFGSNYHLPRHSHSNDCLYYVISGEVHMGSRVVGAGEGFFVAADTTYGYTVGPEGVEMLEFRGHTWFDSQIRETAGGWQRALAAARANRDQWEQELAPYRT